MLTISLDELLAWTAEERAKWLPWFKANRAALTAPVQPGGRFPTVVSLVDHTFLVEVRHTRRLQRQELPAQTGVAPGDIDALWAYGAKGRADVHRYLPTLTDEDAKTPREVIVQSGGSFSMTPRKLLFHMGLHEVRHWAQIAAAVRMAGFAPPGDHDLFYSKALL
ncbi:MAG: DinB family protein [Vicinamibacterales bacterium]